MTYAIVACARNEGPFLVEWLAHHLAIGFDKIFVATNDCDDGSDQLLDLIGAQWPVFRIENSVPLEDHTFQRSAVKRGLAHAEMADQDWALHIDLDEFLNIDGSDVAGFMAGFEDAHALMLAWRIFGSGDRAHWDGGGVLDGFVTCQAEPERAAQKPMFRTSVFGDAAPHCPKAPSLPFDELRVVNTEGVLLDHAKCYRPRGTVLDLEPDQLVWTGASINHYMHKSRDLTTLSRLERGDANGRKRARFRRTPGTAEYVEYDCNEVQDISIQSSRASRIAIMNRILATPGVLEAHYAAHRWFFDRLSALDEPG